MQKDDNAVSESRNWQVFLITIFIIVTGYNTYMQIQFHERGYIGTGPWKGLTRFEEVDQGSSADKAGIRQGDLIIAIDDLLLLEDEYHARPLTITEWCRFDELTEYGNTPLVTVYRANAADIRKQDGELITARLTSVPIALRYRTDAVIFFISNFICLGLLLFFLAGKSSTLPARLFCFCLILNWAGIFSQIFSYSKIFVVVQILSLYSVAIATHIFLIWPTIHPIKKRFPLLIHWLYSFYAVFLFFVVFIQLKREYFLNYRFLEIFVAISFIMIIALVIKQNRIGNNQQRQKIGWFSLINLFFATMFCLMVIFLSGYYIFSYLSGTLNKEHIDFLIFHFKKLLWLIWLIGTALAGVMAFRNYRPDFVLGFQLKAMRYLVISIVIASLLIIMATGLVFLDARLELVRGAWLNTGFFISAVIVVLLAVWRSNQLVNWFVHRWVFRYRLTPEKSFKLEEKRIASNPPEEVYRYYRDIPFARIDEKNLTLDISVPEGDGPFPMLVVIHGGEWELFTNRLMEGMSRYITNQGYVVFNINYRTLSEVPMEMIVGDAMGALIWAKEHAHEYGADPLRVAIIGDSAGAHLTSMMLTQGKNVSIKPTYTGNGKSDPSITCAINAYGLFDFIEINRNVPFFAEKAMGVKYKDNPDRYTFLSPRLNVSPDLVPQLVMIGDRDWFFEDSMKYVDTLREKEAPVELWIYEGKNHSFLDCYWNEKGTVAYDRMIEFLDKHLK